MSKPGRLSVLALACVLAAPAAFARGGIPVARCSDTRAGNWAEATGVSDPRGDVRVYAIQFKQDIRHVESYDSFDAKMRCLMHELVLPTADLDRDLRADNPTIVVFNEDAGLATIATGSRGPLRAPSQRTVRRIRRTSPAR